MALRNCEAPTYAATRIRLSESIGMSAFRVSCRQMVCGHTAFGQNARSAAAIADRARVPDVGKLVYEGGAAEIGRDERRLRELAGARDETWKRRDVETR